MDIWSLLFPRRCLGCGEIGSYLCFNCLNYCRPMLELYCPVCRRPSFNGNTHLYCRKKTGLDGVISCFAYQGVVKRVVAAFKYKFIYDISQTVTELLISNCSHPLLINPKWTLIPIPLHPERLKWRGFNQAAVLAEGAAKAWNLPHISVIRRVKNTHTQMLLSGDERRGNLRDAFEVVRSPVPKSILLVDDVATTCSTLMECAKTLKQAGAKEVWGLTLAQTVPN